MGFIDNLKNISFVNKKNFAVVATADYEEAKKGLADLKTIANYQRPEDLSGLSPNMTLADFSSMISPIDLYQMSKYSDVLRNVIPTIRNEIFRNGYDVQADETELSTNQDDKIQNLFDRANHNEQTLKEVLSEFEDDLQIIDNAYLLAIKAYNINSDGDIIGGIMDELIRVDPLIVEKVLDRQARLAYHQDGRQMFFSIKDRSKILYTERDSEGYQCLRACYKVKTGDKAGEVAYYDSNEMLHVSKYNPSKTYGFSQLYSLYNKVMTLIQQDNYIKQYYSGSKVPKGILVANTTNSTSFEAMWKAFLSKIKTNPNTINPIVNQTSDPSKSNTFQFISFMNNLQEMQYTEGRNEMRQQIGSLFNVSPLFQGDMSAGGGLNNEGLQITVTNRGAEMGQSIYNDKVFPWIFRRNMGITDYIVKLKPSDEIDELAEKDLRLKDLQIAKATAELGINVAMEKDGTFTYDAGTVKLKEDTAESFIPFGKSDIKKSDKIPKKEQVLFQTALEKELDEIVKQLDFSKKPSESELNNLIERITKNLNKRLNAKSANFIKVIYEKAKNNVEKEIGEKFDLNEKDKNIIEALKRDPTYRKSFDGISSSMSLKLTDIVKQAYDNPKEFTIDKIVNKMKEELNSSTDNLRSIARTETTKVSIAARKVQYDKTGFDYLFKVIGPDDNRTGEDSKEIKKLTKKGVTWDDLVKIIQKVAGSKWDVDPNAPIPRPNWRHIPVGIRK